MSFVRLDKMEIPDEQFQEGLTSERWPIIISQRNEAGVSY
jgi:hypothetical protein